jgi:hypothetical protein
MSSMPLVVFSGPCVPLPLGYLLVVLDVVSGTHISGF